MKTILSIVTLLGLVGAGTVYWLKYYRTEGASTFRMAQIERGDMMPTIGATGTVEPEEVVDVGAQVAGLIKELKVDYGSFVEKDTVLARIDDTKYKAQYDLADAAVRRARADLGQLKAKLAQSQADLKRAEELIKTKSIAASDYDAAVANFEVAKANVDVGDAAIKQSEATLKLAQTDLGYTVITSPVKGVIVDRRVNVGQTVVAAFNAPSLFLLAKDLGRMQVWASVNEADIGRIRPGVKVHFTVDAYPNDTFLGEVSQIRLNASMTQNVVTYTVVVTTENKEMKLLPYMTANLLFEIERHENVLKVPNAALRWKPRSQQIAPDVRDETVAAMNRRGDKSKRGDNKKSEEKGGPAKDTVQDSVPSTQSAEPPTQDVKPAPTVQTSAGQGASLATSAGTATGSKPTDWKARTEKNAQKDSKSVSPVVPPAAKSSDSERQPPGHPVPPQVAAAKKEHHESGRLWIVEGNFVRPLPVKIIATDGMMTEVRAKAISEGMDVAIGESVASDGDSGDTTNPFMPKLFRGKSGSGSKSK